MSYIRAISVEHTLICSLCKSALPACPGDWATSPQHCFAHLSLRRYERFEMHKHGTVGSCQRIAAAAKGSLCCMHQWHRLQAGHSWTPTQQHSAPNLHTLFIYCSTVKLVKRSGLASRVLKSQRGRACQMNAGAEAATADLLCFLHADTLPPNDLVSQLGLLWEYSNPCAVRVTTSRVLHINSNSVLRCAACSCDSHVVPQLPGCCTLSQS